MTPELTQRIEELENKVRSLEASYTIPHNVSEAFRDRLGINDLASLAGSTKNPSTETQAVAESGASSYSVAKPMDGFREFVVGGTVLYIPYYT